MSTAEFLERFEEFLGRNGWPTSESPWALVDRWESLVDQASTGYHWGYYEFANDLSIRDLLSKALDDEVLSTYQQMTAIRDRVDQADARLRSLLLPDTRIGGSDEPWWHRGVLASAGDEYTDDVKRLYDIEPRP